MKTLTTINLNEAFGFATIVAALEVVRANLAVPFSEVDLWKGLFLLYFFVFRVKMYIDDSNHHFSETRLAEIGVAIASWIAFLISVSAVTRGINVAIEWFILAMVLSTVWVILAWRKATIASVNRYRWFFVVNVLHIAGLAIALWIPVVLVPLTIFVFADAVATKTSFKVE